MELSKREIAKYPFTKAAAQYVKDLNLKIEDLVSPDYVKVIERSRQRVEEALIYKIVSWPRETDERGKYDVEILSFPVAIIIVTSINDDFLKRRFALAEANRVNKLLFEEENEQVINILGSFDWDVRTVKPTEEWPYDFTIYFVDYLKNSTAFADVKWKLVNREVDREGRVFLHKNELVRLITEEVRKHIYKGLKSDIQVKLPLSLVQKTNGIKQILDEKVRRFKKDDVPKAIVQAAYPPCIERLYSDLMSKRHIPHLGRFTLTSFLLNIGVKMENIVRLYTSATDFEERLTKYQVEHIAGKRGGSTKYKPPNCNTLRTYRLCPGGDEICKVIRNPLTYYQKKIRIIRAKKQHGRKE
jgi:DNA primase large subunit